MTTGNAWAGRPRSHRHRLGWRVLVISTAIWSTCSGGAELSVTVKKLADTQTAVPGPTSGNFSKLHTPAIDHGRITFAASDGFGQVGVYYYDGSQLLTVADSTTVLPGASTRFETIGNGRTAHPSVAGRHVAFVGGGPGVSGIYRWDGLQLQTMVDTTERTTDGNGGTTPFREFNAEEGIDVAVGGVVVVDAFADRRNGFYRATDGAVSLIALRNELSFPSTTRRAERITNEISDGSRTSFVARDRTGDIGLYRLTGGRIDVIADQATTAPGRPGSFREFIDVAQSGNRVAFAALSPGLVTGIYLHDGTRLSRIADTLTLPDGGVPGTLPFAASPAIDGTDVAFVGGTWGVYTTIGGGVNEVINASKPFDGKQLISVKIGPRGLSARRLALQARFSDFSEAVYVLTIRPSSEPAPPADDDGDAIANSQDNCRRIANNEQLNLDRDAIGDACDEDDDGDGLNDLDEVNRLGTNPANADTDGDRASDGDEIASGRNPLVNEAAAVMPILMLITDDD